MTRFDHFSFLAPFYDRAIQLKDPERIIRMISLPVDGALLDAGGGTGRVSIALRGMAHPLIVADVSCGMLRQAMEKDGLKAVCSHSETLPFGNHTFDRVIMVDALHHVINHRETALELWRVVKPGGRIVIEEPDIQSWAVKVIALAEKVALMRSHFISPKRIQALFPYSDATIRIERQDHNAWIIIDKSAVSL